jgi:hypothetical protein
MDERTPKLDPRLTGMEQVFRAPPLTPELVAAIKLISPHCDFPATETYRSLWQADQNGACWDEYETLAPLFRSIRTPMKILEIGPGMGRSLAFFSKKLDWGESEIHAYEGEGSTTKYTVLGPRFEDSFCGNFQALQSVLEFNEVRNVKMFNAREVRLADMPGPYDLIYSFYSIGFHWSIDHFLDDILPLLHAQSVGLFTIPQQFEISPRVKELPHRIVDWKTAPPNDAWWKILVVGKGPLPQW